ncbi:MAG TPA: hypothetical protein VHO91_19590 [Rhodopila sp.]|nr:hypothetical protein [Rhodopila sp.]
MRYRCLGGIAACLLLATLAQARAGVSPQDGYGPDGTPRLRVEIAPYFWLPATNAQVTLGRGATANINAGMPSISQLSSVLTGAFLGMGRLRYGPWSAELDIDYIGASQDQALPPGLLGISRSLQLSANTVRVAPGIGYQVFNGPVGGVPATLDALAGFSWFTTTSTLNLDQFGPFGRERTTSVSASGAFTQPWLGLRAAIYPAPRWRFELSAQGQGFGVGGGTWGWQVAAIGTWAATNWLNLNAGFVALHEAGLLAPSRVIKAVDTTFYGPMLSVSFTF